ncbi:MAG TPA: GGDEF domain-containing protein [Clostridia bacterium]|jgi:putative two-component system response regulator|nr:GGDEF domain-containing protein [Clostridia bacterium]HPY97946.1 GGDEF domain-containing protein [Clostridia bacterium]HQC67995.1 GGDEF domain-containing protein [Clostridia bacterium]
MKFTRNELLAFLKEQRKVFDIVRLVDVSLTTQYEITDSGELIQGPYQCYTVWNKEKRCENCVSAKAFAIKGKLTKFEFVNNDIYFVTSIYTEVEGTPYMLEMVDKLNDDVLFGAYGKDKFVDTITEHNRKLYIDTLTGAYNRLYYSEQLQKLTNIKVIAMFDVDNFKTVNDTYGHPVGDYVLQEIVRIIIKNIRKSDAVIRTGGDEFLLILQDIPYEKLSERLENIRKKIECIRCENCPDLRVTVSIGAIYADNDVTSLMEMADKKLYESKKNKNTVTIARH